MKKILVLATGGTISHDVNEDGIHVTNEDENHGNTFEKILRKAASKLGNISVSSRTILNKDSANMIMKDWQTIVNSIVESYDNYDAFIVTHGTETMGYATAAVSFAIGNLGKPVVFTGAQESFGMPGSDAIINLENCLRFIVCAENLAGVYLVFGTQILKGTHAKKISEFDYDAFKVSKRFSKVGVIGYKITLKETSLQKYIEYYRPFAKTAQDLKIRNSFEENIIVLSEFPGLRSDVIINLAKSGVKGFVLRSYGSGVPNVARPDADFDNLRPALEYLRDKKIPLAVTTQANDSVASMDIYEPSILAKELGAIPCYDMTIESVVAKMSWLLGNGNSYEKIQKLLPKAVKDEVHH